MSKLATFQYGWLILAVIMLIMFAVQYPWQTTFPMGGDAAPVIQVSRSLLSEPQGILASRYPLSHLILSSFALLPVDWPNRFIWCMAVGHISAGIMIGLLLYRIRDPFAAALGVAIWSLSAITVNTHFEDATLAQLWSLSFLVWFFERLYARSWWGVGLATLASILAHPITGVIVIITVVGSLLPLWSIKSYLRLDEKKTLNVILIGSLMLLIMSSTYFFSNFSHFTNAFVSTGSGIDLLDLIRSHFGLFVMLSPLGVILIVKHYKQHPLFVVNFIMFCMTAVLLVFNDQLGIGLWTNRFRTYFILLITITASFSLHHLLPKLFLNIILRSVFLVVLFAFLATAAWQDNRNVYARYESPSRYARLHTLEMEAMHWAKDNLPAKSAIYTTNANRHGEWIPIFTSHEWHEINEGGMFFTKIMAESQQQEHRNNSQNRYFLFFTFVEKVNEEWLKTPQIFPVLYQNSAVTIIKLP